MNEEVLSVENLSTSFQTAQGTLRVVRDVSFHMGEEILGVVGESGSGKSVLMKSILSLLPLNASVSCREIRLDGASLHALTGRERQKICGDSAAMIFQDPMSALDPLHTVGAHLREVLRGCGVHGKENLRRQAEEALRMVGIPDPEKRLGQYPHEFSGGMRQRVLIAMALCCRPRLLIADEPTTALDVTIQAQILRLLRDLQREKHMGVILITHDLSVVASVCTRVLVMYGGRMMEEGSAEDVFYHPAHPYTRALLAAIPQVEQAGRLTAIPGAPPSFRQEEPGCPFAPRCALAETRCRERLPDRIPVGEKHWALCHLAESFGKEEAPL